MKRKTFLRRSIPIVTVPFLLNGLSIRAFGKGSAFEQLLDSAVENDRILVLVQLVGGNDGLNTVIPLDKYSQLSNARSNILIPSNKVLPINGTTATGLHPSMNGIRNMYNDGKVSIVQGVSYPNPNFSHFRATDIWLSASDSDEVITSGWMGRYFATKYPDYPTGYPNTDSPDPLALQIGSLTSNALQGPNVSMGIAVASLSYFYELTTGTTAPAPNTPAGRELTFLRQTAQQTNAYNDAIKVAANKQSSNPSTKWGSITNSSLADQLKIVSRLIGGGLQTKVYMVSLGGFDTHNGQANNGSPETGDHANLLKKVSEAIEAFQDDIKIMGQQDRVLGMTFSEFGRRIKSNSSLGTDHGSAAPVILFGNKVKAGLVGTNPNIPANAGVNDNLDMQYDFRSLYTTILKNWFCVSDDVLNASMLKSFSTLDLLTVGCTTGIDEVDTSEPQLRNYPNPANSSTIIEFQTTGGNIRMDLYDELGKEIQTIAEGNYAPGMHQVEVNTNRLPRGIYFYTLRQGERRTTRKMLVM